MVAKGITAGLLAGAFLFAGPKKAEAQVSVGVQIGGPVVYPGYYGRQGYYPNRNYYERLRFEQERRAAFERQQAWERRQAWIRHEQHERWEHERHDHGWDRR
jgi:hypothetical protein